MVVIFDFHDMAAVGFKLQLGRLGLLRSSRGSACACACPFEDND